MGHGMARYGVPVTPHTLNILTPVWRAAIFTYIHTYIHTCIHAYIHTYVHTLHTYLTYVTLRYITFHHMTRHDTTLHHMFVRGRSRRGLGSIHTVTLQYVTDGSCAIGPKTNHGCILGQPDRTGGKILGLGQP